MYIGCNLPLHPRLQTATPNKGKTSGAKYSSIPEGLRSKGLRVKG